MIVLITYMLIYIRWHRPVRKPGSLECQKLLQLHLAHIAAKKRVFADPRISNVCFLLVSGSICKSS